MVFAIAGLFKWIDDGATLDKSVIEAWEDDPPTWTGSIGHFIHVMNGTFLIPLLGIILLIVSFFAAVNGGRQVGGHRRGVDRGPGARRAVSPASRPTSAWSTGSTRSSCSARR